MLQTRLNVHRYTYNKSNFNFSLSFNRESNRDSCCIGVPPDFCSNMAAGALTKQSPAKSNLSWFTMELATADRHVQLTD
jgi:hypothetical protein